MLLKIFDRKVKWYSSYRNQFGSFYKTKPTIYSPEITILEIYPREMKTYDYVKICTQMFIAALFVYPQIRNNSYAVQHVND